MGRDPAGCEPPLQGGSVEPWPEAEQFWVSRSMVPTVNSDLWRQETARALQSRAEQVQSLA